MPWIAAQRHSLTAAIAGAIVSINHHRIARLAKLAGAAEAKAAGAGLHVQLVDRSEAGQPARVVRAGMPGELDYARDPAAANLKIVWVSVE